MKKWSRQSVPFVVKVLRLFMPHDEFNESAGDLIEWYPKLEKERGIPYAKLWLLWQGLKLLPVYFIHHLCWRIIMFRNYFKIAVRNLKRHKSYSTINILGLILGLTCFFLIMIFIQNEFSFDTFHKKGDRIYRVLINQDHFYQGRNQAAVLPAGFGPTIKSQIPEVKMMTRIEDGEGLFEVNGFSFTENGLGFVDPDFLKMFDFPLLSGDLNTALDDPFSLILSEKMAHKYFGNQNALGKTITVDGEYEYTVKGIMKNIPANSYFQFDCLASIFTLNSIYGQDRLEKWNNYNYVTFLLFEEGTDVTLTLEKIRKIFNERKFRFIIDCELQHLKEIHFHQKALFEKGMTADIRTVYILSTIGFVILLIACFNYINLATARASTRLREIGIRKVVGAQKRDLIRQFLGESFGFVFTSFLVSSIIVTALLPTFASFMHREIPLISITTPSTLLFIMGSLVVIAIIAGIYPAILLSSFRPAAILGKTSSVRGGSKSTFRNILVIVQFIFTTGLILCTLVTNEQVSFMKNKDLGFIKDHILTFSAENLDIEPQIFKQELLQFPGIEGVTLSSQTPSSISSADLPSWDGKPENEEGPPFFRLRIDQDFFSLYDIPIKLGRNFTKTHSTDLDESIIINQSAVETVGWTEPIGKKLYSGDESWTVIGVIEDFHFQSLRLSIAPLMIKLSNDEIRTVSIKIRPDDVESSLRFINEAWKKYSSGFPLDYSFLDDRLTRYYRAELRLNQSFQTFALIAVFIACLGLFGLASYHVEQKTKEIGMRKVLGATVPAMFLMTLKQTLKMVAIGTLIALPVGYLIMNKWLENFAYRIQVGPDQFILASILAVAVAFFTTSYLSVRAATANPVDSLRYE